MRSNLPLVAVAVDDDGEAATNKASSGLFKMFIHGADFTVNVFYKLSEHRNRGEE